MKLSQKLILSFAGALLFVTLVIFVGFPRLFNAIAERQMMKEAQTFSLFILHNLQDIVANRGLTYGSDESAIEDLIFSEFEKAIGLAGETESFVVDEIILLGPDYTVEVGFPADQRGQDYSSHPDVVARFQSKDFVIGLEQHMTDGAPEVDIDVVAYLSISGRSRVLEVKLNFEQTTALLRTQYRRFTILAVAGGFVIMLALLVLLLVLIRRTAVLPAMRLTKALEEVGGGNLEVSVEHRSSDEFGRMAREFNAMVTGLKERLQLSKYVSASTVEAVRTAVSSGGDFHAPRRKTMTLFFSDIRGFTTYSERHEPEQVVGVLNRILGMQAQIIERGGGVVDKFVGDEVMALFERPEDAILCALRIQHGFQQNPEQYDGLRIGIGIHGGPVVEGDIGSESARNFTVIGDTVNTAARLQAIAEGGEILVSEALAREDFFADRFAARRKGTAHLKGKQEDVTVYSVRGTKRGGGPASGRE